jgi:hypothetical protein
MLYLPKLVGVGGNRSASDVLASTELLGIRLLSLDRFAKVEIKGQFEDVCTRSFSLRAELREPIRTR